MGCGRGLIANIVTRGSSQAPETMTTLGFPYLLSCSSLQKIQRVRLGQGLYGEYRDLHQRGWLQLPLLLLIRKLKPSGSSTPGSFPIGYIRGTAMAICSTRRQIPNLVTSSLWPAPGLWNTAEQKKRLRYFSLLGAPQRALIQPSLVSILSARHLCSPLPKPGTISGSPLRSLDFPRPGVCFNYSPFI